MCVCVCVCEQKRLQVLSKAGLPLFISEMDVRHTDMTKRAEGYEDLMRLYFSHPHVHGIVLWGFWEENISYSTAALAEGKKNIKVGNQTYISL